MNEVKKFLIIFYLVGIVGFCIPYTQSFFMVLTPFALMLNFVLLFYFHEPATLRAYSIMILIALLGFVIEALGVKTGVIFGNYTYGRVLGPRLFSTPYLIGINWLVLTYTASVILNRFFKSNFFIALVGASMVTVFDVIMEPVAIFTGMWSWEGNRIPFQNYVMWFIISFGFIFLLSWQTKANKNPLASWIFILQAIFFAILLLVIKIVLT